MHKTVSRGIFLALALIFCGSLAQAQQLASIVMDARTGRVIQATNADTRVYPASLTKMMTLYIVFDEIQNGRMSLDQKVTISPKAASEPPSRLGLRAGQQIEVRYLIRAAAIKSANDAATALGEAVAGSEDAFAVKMNQYARALGMTNSTFKNANGLPREGHMSTARDMAILGRHLIYDFPQYYNIFGRTSTSAGTSTVQNTNRRLLESYPGADGIKTGYTKAAGFNLVSSAHRGNQRVVVALLGGKSSASRNAEVARLMDVGFAKMPAVAKLDPPTPARMLLASAGTPKAKAVAATQPIAATVASTAVVARAPKAADDADEAIAMDNAPKARADAASTVAATRNNQSIMAAINEVNAELAADVAARVADGRPQPRPSTTTEVAATVQTPNAPGNTAQAIGVVGSASTFAVAQVAARQKPAQAPDPNLEAVSMNAGSSAGTGTTGGNEWGVQLGSYRAKGDAERQLLTTALRDVPGLAGGLRRVEAAKVQGTTVYRAQFVGLSQTNAMNACEALTRQKAECLPLAPGI